MKKFLISLLLLTVSILFAVPIQLYPPKKANKTIVGFALHRDKDFHWMLFKLAKDAPADVVIDSIYLNTDQDKNTGRKKVGNEYYIVPLKKGATAYSKDGKERGFRRSTELFRLGEWIAIRIKSEVFRDNPLKEYSFWWRNKTCSASIIVAPGVKTIEAEMPQLPSAEDVKKKAEALRPKQKNTMTSWMTPGIVHINSLKDNNGKKSVTLNIPRNGTGDFQLAAYYSGYKAGRMTLKWTPPISETANVISADPLRMYRVINVPFIEPTDEKLKYSLRFPAGTLFRKTSIPDRLSRYKMGSGTGDYKMSLRKRLVVWHGTVSIPESTRPGTYESTFTLTWPEGKEDFKLIVKVDDFTIPERPSFVMFADMPRACNYVSSLKGTANGMDVGNDVSINNRSSAITMNLEECLRELKFHRIAPRKVLVPVPIKFDKDEKPVIDFSSIDAFTKFVVDDLKMNPRFEMPLLTVSTGHNAHYTRLFGPIGRDHMSDEFRRKYAATVKAVSEHLKAKKWDKYFFAYFSDEPGRQFMAQTKEIISIINKVDPNLSPWIFGPGPTKEYINELNTWMGGFGTPLEAGEVEHNPNSEAVRIAKERGDKIGLYNPRYPINAAPATVRALYWWAFQQELYWMSHYCVAYFHASPRDISNAGYWGYWVYPPNPGKAGTWDNSIRLEATRAGLTDYEYLKALTDRVAELQKNIPSAKFKPNVLAIQYTRAVARSKNVRCGDDALITRIRDIIGKEIKELANAPGFVNYSVDKDKVTFSVYAVPGTVVKYGAETRTAGNEPLIWSLPAQEVLGKEQCFVLGKSTVHKTAFAEF